MRDSIYTENLEDFGSRERKMASALLDKPLPSAFADSGVKLAMNKNSGYVFLVNDDYQCAMINCDNDQLEIFHSTPHEGYEGFLIELLNGYEPSDLNSADADYLRNAIKAEDLNEDEIPAAWKE